MRMLASAVSPATVQVAWPQSLYVFSDVCIIIMNVRVFDGVRVCVGWVLHNIDMVLCWQEGGIGDR